MAEELVFVVNLTLVKFGPVYDPSRILDIRPKVRSFVNFVFRTPSAALIVKWSAANVIS
jgi:hypothetical protein